MARSYGITCCVIIIFINCFWSFKGLLNVQWYWYIFHYLPPHQIMLRYITSWVARILLIAACIGIWQLKDWGRRLAVIICIGNILTLPWKHPTMAIEYSFNYYHILPRLNEWMREIVPARRINLILLSAVCLSTWDFLFNAGLAIFFSLNKIKKQFR